MSEPLAGLLLLLVAFLALLSFTRSALVSVRRSALQALADDGNKRAASVLRLLEDDSRVLFTFRVSRSLARFTIVSLVVAAALVPMASWAEAQGIARSMALILSALIISFLVTLLIVGLAELLPEALAASNATTWALRLGGFADALIWWFSPLVVPLVSMNSRLSKPLASMAPLVETAEDLKSLMDAGEEGGAIDVSERRLINSIFRFSDTWVREVMVPRIDVLALDVETSAPEALDAILAAGYSRVPVFEDTIDDIKGLLYAKDLLKVWRDGATNTPIAALLRPAYFVPETKRIDHLLAEMRQQRVHMAVVVDEYGGIAGIATLEDVVEEIIGEVQDEYDSVEEMRLLPTGDGAYLVDGGLDLDDLNEMLGTHLDTEDADTVAGLIFERLGRVPVPGDEIEVDNVTLNVTGVVGRRIRRVRLEMRTSDELPDDTDDEDEE